MTDAGRAAPTRAGHRPLGIFLGALVVLGTYVLGSGRLGLAVAWATVTPRGGAATQTALVSPVPGRSATLGWTSTARSMLQLAITAWYIAKVQTTGV